MEQIYKRWFKKLENNSQPWAKSANSCFWAVTHFKFSTYAGARPSHAYNEIIQSLESGDIHTPLRLVRQEWGGQTRSRWLAGPYSKAPAPREWTWAMSLGTPAWFCLGPLQHREEQESN